MSLTLETPNQDATLALLDNATEEAYLAALYVLRTAPTPEVRALSRCLAVARRTDVSSQVLRALNRMVASDVYAATSAVSYAWSAQALFDCAVERYHERGFAIPERLVEDVVSDAGHAGKIAGGRAMERHTRNETAPVVLFA